MPRDQRRSHPDAPIGLNVANGGRSQPLLIAALAMSLDGFIATPKGGVEWLNDYTEALKDMPEFMRTVGSIIIGRTTYDASLNLAPPDVGGDGFFGAARTYVLTHRPLDPARGVIAVAGDVRDIAARALRESTGGNVWIMGGGVVLRAFWDADLIDRLQIAVIPVILGDGIPLMPRSTCRPRALQLTSTRKYSDGVIELAYERAPTSDKSDTERND